MRRRRNESDKVIDALIAAMFRYAKSLPWYLSLIVAAVLYFSFHHLYVLYSKESASGVELIFRVLSLVLQYLLPAIFGAGAIMSAIYSLRNRELFRSAGEGRVMENVSKMNWQDFERLIGEYFKTQGYSVTQEGGAHADGGVDVELHKDGQLYLVQCKHYRSWKVPVETIRDLYGAMTARGAVGGFVVTSGRFTKPAKEFVEGRSITLIDGKELSRILVQLPSENHNETPPNTDNTVPSCPKCGNLMIRRTAHKGAHVGQEFWGCSQYPACRGVKEIS